MPFGCTQAVSGNNLAKDGGRVMQVYVSIRAGVDELLSGKTQKDLSQSRMACTLHTQVLKRAQN